MAKKTFDSRVPWLKGRKKTIGSSDGPAILGYGYSGQSAATVWASKVHDTVPEMPEATKKLMAEGKICEQFVVERFRIAHPELRVEAGSEFDITVCQEHPYIAASLDAEAYDAECMFPIEAKWIGWHMRRDWADGETPLKYQIQLMHQMLCTGAKRGCIAAFVAGEYVERWFDRDEEVIEFMIEKYQEFWSHVINRTPPEDSNPEAFKQIRGEISKGTAKMAGGKLSTSVRDYIDLNRKAKEAQERADKLKNRLAQEVGGHEYLILDDQQPVKVGKGSIKEVKKLPRNVEVSY